MYICNVAVEYFHGVICCIDHRMVRSAQFRHSVSQDGENSSVTSSNVEGIICVSYVNA